MQEKTFFNSTIFPMVFTKADFSFITPPLCTGSFSSHSLPFFSPQAVNRTRTKEAPKAQGLNSFAAFLDQHTSHFSAGESFPISEDLNILSRFWSEAAVKGKGSCVYLPHEDSLSLSGQAATPGPPGAWEQTPRPGSSCPERNEA